MPEPDLATLRAFEAIYLERSITRAAHRLGLAQSSVSSALARLRLVFDDQLFVRSGSEMRPTARAEAIAPQLLATLAGLSALLAQTLAFDPATAVRTFTLGATDYGARILLPALIDRLGDQAPGVSLRVVSYVKAQVAADLDRGLIDLALGVFPDAPGRTVRTPLFDERLIGVARSGHPLLANGSEGVDLQAFAACGHVLVTVARDSAGVVDEALAAQGLQRRIALTLPFAEAALACVRGCDLITALPARLVDATQPDLTTFEVPLTLPPWTLSMLWLADMRQDQGLAWLRGVIRGLASSL